MLHYVPSKIKGFYKELRKYKQLCPEKIETQERFDTIYQERNHDVVVGLSQKYHHDEMIMENMINVFKNA